MGLRGKAAMLQIIRSRISDRGAGLSHQQDEFTYQITKTTISSGNVEGRDWIPVSSALVTEPAAQAARVLGPPR
jgi:hypothetical protein